MTPVLSNDEFIIMMQKKYINSDLAGSYKREKDILTKLNELKKKPTVPSQNINNLYARNIYILAFSVILFPVFYFLFKGCL